MLQMLAVDRVNCVVVNDRDTEHRRRNLLNLQCTFDGVPQHVDIDGNKSLTVRDVNFKRHNQAVR